MGIFVTVPDHKPDGPTLNLENLKDAVLSIDVPNIEPFPEPEMLPEPDPELFPEEDVDSQQNDLPF